MVGRLNEECVVVKNPSVLVSEKIILPGVESFDTGMTNLHEQGWAEKDILADAIEFKTGKFAPSAILNAGGFQGRI